MTTSLNEYAEYIHRWSNAQGFYDGVERTFGDDLMLISTELAEAYEEYRNHKQPNEIYYSEGGKPEGIPTELADVLIRVLDTMHHYGINIQHVVDLKMQYNVKRPPMNGGKRI